MRIIEREGISWIEIKALYHIYLRYRVLPKLNADYTYDLMAFIMYCQSNKLDDEKILSFLKGISNENSK